MPENFDSNIFNSIMSDYQTHSVNQMMEELSIGGKLSEIDELRKTLQLMFSKTKSIEDWKNSNWPGLLEWYGDFDLMQIVKLGLHLPRLL